MRIFGQRFSGDQGPPQTFVEGDITWTSGSGDSDLGWKLIGRLPSSEVPQWWIDPLSGDGCVMEDNCVMTRDHPDSYNESDGCKVYVRGMILIDVADFNTQPDFDVLTLGNEDYSGTIGPPNGYNAFDMEWNPTSTRRRSSQPRRRSSPRRRDSPRRRTPPVDSPRRRLSPRRRDSPRRRTPPVGSPRRRLSPRRRDSNAQPRRRSSPRNWKICAENLGEGTTSAQPTSTFTAQPSTRTTTSPPGRAGWEITEGDGCQLIGARYAVSSHFPSNYGAFQTCTIRTFGDLLIEAPDFQTANENDFMTIFGQRFSGDQGPPQTFVEGDITWTSGSGDTDLGWKL